MNDRELPIAGLLTVTMHKDRWCKKCEQVCEGGKPDACLDGTIPGVSHTCCGHGITEPYVVIGGEPNQACDSFSHWSILRGERATAFFELIREQRHEKTLGLAQCMERIRLKDAA